MKRGSLTHEAVSGVAWQSLAIGANVVVRTAILVILTRSLPPRDFGIIAAAMVIISVTSVLSEIGVARVLVQRLVLPRGIEKSAFAIALYLGVLASILVYITAPWTAQFFSMQDLQPYVEFLAIAVLINAIGTVVASLTQRERRFKAIGLIELGAFLVGFGFVALPLAHFGFGAWSLAIAYLVQCSLKMIAFWTTRPPAIGLWPREGTRELLVTGGGFMMGQAGNFVARQVDYLLVGRMLGPVALGYYNRAYQFLMLPAQLLGTATSKVLFPSISSIQDDTERVRRAYARALGVVAMFTLPISGFLIIIGPELVLTLFGETWIEMILPFQILIASLVFRTSYKISDSVSLAMGSMGARAWRQWIYAGAVALGAGWGAHWGLSGVAIGVCVAVALNFILMTKLAMTITGLSAWPVVTMHLRHFSIALLYSALVYASVFFARTSGWNEFEVLITGTTCAVLVAAVFWFLLRKMFAAEGEWLAKIIEERLKHFRTAESNS